MLHGTDSFIINIKTEDFYKDIASDVERRFDTSNYDKNDKRPLPIGINKKKICMFKDELGGKIMIKIKIKIKTQIWMRIDLYRCFSMQG